MPTIFEQVCCKDHKPMLTKIAEDSLDCLVDHQGFRDNCLSPYVLESSYFEFVLNDGPIGDNEPIHG